MSALEALYIFDSFSPHSTPLLQHEWRSRPSASASTLLQQYQAHPAPQPALLYLPSTSPPILLFSIKHNNLLFLSPSISEIEPLLVLEFLHRVVDVLEDYLGAPLLGAKIESNYDIVTLLLSEMCDDGFPFMTEPNALRDVVTPPSLMGKLLGSVTGLPSGSLPQSFTPSNQNLSTIPWRRSNVKHTNNELYVDLIELVTATIAPSGRALSAKAHGTVFFNSKISGIPDLLLTLQTPNSYKQKLGTPATSLGNLQFPLFHPCVRLARWRERPGELSFVPPDGKFVLASYEVDLLPPISETKGAAKSAGQLSLPVSVELKTALGPQASEFEVRVFVSTVNIANSSSSPSGFGGSGRGTSRSPAFGGSSNNPVIEELSITIPLPPGVKTLVGTRCSRGEFHHEGRKVSWKIPTTGGWTSTGGTATFRSGVVVKSSLIDDDFDEDEEPESNIRGEYTEHLNGDEKEREIEREREKKKREENGNEKLKKKMRGAMPRCALVGFSVKGWLASGVRVESLRVVDVKGLGEGVRPYKGVKYLTKAGGVEVRC
ncbi:hypothetical protein RUND412_004091 [Rhizina undulata]